MKLNDEVKYKHSKTGITYKVVEINGASILLSPLFSDIRIKAQIDEVKKVGSAARIASKPTKLTKRGRKGSKIAR